MTTHEKLLAERLHDYIENCSTQDFLDLCVFLFGKDDEDIVNFGNERLED